MMKTPFAISIGALLFTLSVPAYADSPISFKAEKEKVIVSVEGLPLKLGGTIHRGDRVEFSLAKNVASLSFAVKDKTVKKINVLKRKNKSYLSIQLKHGRRTSGRIARAVELRLKGDSFQVVLPRSKFVKKLQKEKEAAQKQELKQVKETEVKETLITKDVSKKENVVEEKKKKEETKKASKTVVGKTKEKRKTIVVPKEVEAKIAAVNKLAKKKNQSEEKQEEAESEEETDEEEGTLAGIGKADSSGLGTTFLICVFLLLCCGVLIWIAKKKRGDPSFAESINVIAQKNIGPKTKIVLVSVGAREFLLAVSDKGTEMLDQWSADTERSESVADDGLYGRGGRKASGIPNAYARKKTSKGSPSLAGLLKLRKSALEESASTEFDGDVKADAKWARELLRATRTRAERQ